MDSYKYIKFSERIPGISITKKSQDGGYFAVKAAGGKEQFIDSFTGPASKWFPQTDQGLKDASAYYKSLRPYVKDLPNYKYQLPKYDTNYVGPQTNVKKLLNGKLEYKNSKGEITIQKAGESEKNFLNRIKKLGSQSMSAGRGSQTAQTQSIRQKVIDWTNGWLSQNLSKYKPKQVNNFVNDFKKNWKQEAKKPDYKKIATYNATNRAGFPTVGTKSEPFKIGNIVVAEQKPEISYRKIFFENKLNTDADFKKSVDDYFEFFAENKQGQGNQFLKIKPPPGAKDAMFWLSPDSGVTGVARADMFAKIPGYAELFRNYQDKFNRANAENVNSLRILEKKLNLPRRTLTNEMRREHRALAKIFDVKQLPEELKLGYSIEHTQGLAAAVKSDNKNILKAARKDLAGMSLAKNMGLGWGLSGDSFERTRSAYINNIQENLLKNKNVTKDVNNLNKMVYSEYKDISSNKTPYSIINNKLQTSPISSATTQTDRFGQYFNELSQNPKAAPKLLEQITAKPELEKFIKEGQGDIYSNLRKTLVAAAEKNEGNICQLFRKEGGRIGFATGSRCVQQMEFAFDNDPVKLSQDINKLPYEEGPINKVKNSATKFLQSPMLRGAGKFGAIAAGGAVAAGFVKQFMNDDPTTYLSNEEQQKNLLMDMVTGSLDDTPQESPAIGDAYLPALGAATVAGTAAVAPSTIDAVRGGALGAKKSGITKTALKVLGKGLTATQTPLGLLATEPLYLADQIQQGDSLGEIATNPFNYMGAAFVGPATEFATKGGLSPMIAKTMRLGISPNVLKTVSRRFGLPGLALSLGISGYETYDDFKNKRGFFSDEE